MQPAPFSLAPCNPPLFRIFTVSMPRTPRQYFRWLLVQLGLFDKAAFRLALNEVRPTDTFLVSFPKSGNTWLRFLIAHLVSDRNDIHFRNLDALVPDVYMSAAVADRLPSPRYIKTHDARLADYPKTIYIVRDYRDVLVSYYHYQLAAKEFSGSFSEYVRTIDTLHPFGSWHAHVEAALDFQSAHPERLHFLHYEELLAAPENELQRIVDFLQIVPKRPLSEAIAACQFARLQELEKKHGSLFNDKSGAAFFREGKSGSWKQTFTPADLERVMQENGRLLQRLGYENA
jgi:estrone sulfotransferase